MITNPAHLAWLAGFMDGEGSFYVSYVTLKRKDRTYPAYRPRVSACNTHLPTMDLVASLFGEHADKVHRVVKQSTSEGGKPVHHVTVTSWESCAAISRVVLPHLVTKVEQASLLLTWCEDRLKRYERGSRFTTGYNDDDHAWYDRLRVLNARGGTEYDER